MLVIKLSTPTPETLLDTIFKQAINVKKCHANFAGHTNDTNVVVVNYLTTEHVHLHQTLKHNN